MKLLKGEIKKSFLVFFIVGAAALILPLSAYAGAMQDLKDFFGLQDWKGFEADLGPVKIKPTLQAYSEFNSNLNLKSDHPENGMVYHVTPGFTVQVPLDRLYVETGADIGYVVVDGNDTHTQAWTGSGRGIIRYDLTESTSVGLKELYSRGYTYAIVDDNRYDDESTYFDAKHQFGPRLALALGFNRERYETHIKNGYPLPFTDFHDLGGNITLDYKLTPTTNLSLNGYGGKRSYLSYNEKDYNKRGGSLTISQNITPHINFGINLGYDYRDYKFSADNREITYGSNVDFILSNFSKLSFTYNYGVYDTLYPRSSDALPTPFDNDQTLNYELFEEYRYMDVDHYGLYWTQNLSDKDTLIVGGEYMKSHSGGSNALTIPGDTYLLSEELKEYGYYGGINYAHRFLSWLSFRLGGSYGARTSNVREKYDYYTANGGLAFSY